MTTDKIATLIEVLIWKTLALMKTYKKIEPYIEKILILSIYSFAAGLIFEFGILWLIVTQDPYYLIAFKVPVLSLINPSLVYMGYPLSFIIFGSYLIIMNKKFRLLSIPIFLLTYVIWEITTQPLLHIITSQQPFFLILIAITIPFIFVSNHYFRIEIPLFYLLIYWLFGIQNFLNIVYPVFNSSEPSSEITFCLLTYKSVHLK